MATKQSIKSLALAKAKSISSKGEAKSTKKKLAVPEGQNPPQSKSYTIKKDESFSAKPVGMRWTKEGARKLGKKETSRPSAADIKMYSGKTFKIPRKPNGNSEDGSYRYMYSEKRIDKSDFNRKEKFASGGKLSDGTPLYTKGELLKKYKGKFIDVYPHHYLYRNPTTHQYETVFEVKGVSSKIKENFQSPDEAIDFAKGGSTIQKADGMDIIAYNKRCAEFLGFKYRNSKKAWGEYPLDNSSFLASKGWISMDRLQFHSDWNWIMDVIEAIGKIADWSLECLNEDNDRTYQVLIYLSNTNITSKDKKETVVKAINQFLIWYETRQKPDENFSHGGSTQQFYVDWSSWFDSHEYDTDAIKEALKKSGATDIHEENLYGWYSQPSVIVFRGDKKKAEAAVQDALGTEWIIINEKNWRNKKSMADGGSTEEPIDIDEVLRHYLMAALWVEMDDNEEPLENNYGISDVDEKSKDRLRAMITTFVKENEEAIKSTGMTDDQLGHDIFLNQNRHGVGFWDRGYGDVGETLSNAARKLGEVYVEVGDDGKIRFQGSIRIITIKN